MMKRLNNIDDNNHLKSQENHIIDIETQSTESYVLNFSDILIKILENHPDSTYDPLFEMKSIPLSLIIRLGRISKTHRDFVKKHIFDTLIIFSGNINISILLKVIDNHNFENIDLSKVSVYSDIYPDIIFRVRNKKRINLSNMPKNNIMGYMSYLNEKYANIVLPRIDKIFIAKISDIDDPFLLENITHFNVSKNSKYNIYISQKAIVNAIDTSKNNALIYFLSNHIPYDYIYTDQDKNDLYLKYLQGVKNFQKGGPYPLVEFMIKSGINVNHYNLMGETALSVASQMGNIEIVKFLLKNGADPNVGNGNAFAYALSNISNIFEVKKYNAGINHTLVALMILEYSPNLNAIRSNTTPLICCIKKKEEQIFLLLINKYNVDINQIIPDTKEYPLLAAIESNHYFFVKTLLDKGAKLYYDHTEDSGNLIRKAIEYNNDTIHTIQILNKLVEHGDIFDNDIIYYCIDHNVSEEIVLFFIKAGADINKTNSNGDNILIHSIQKEMNVGFLTFVLSLGIDINIVNNQGKNALMSYISKKHDTPIIYYLIDKTDNINQKDIDGQNALILAIKNGHDIHILEKIFTKMKEYDYDQNWSISSGGNVLIHLIENKYGLDFFAKCSDYGADINYYFENENKKYNLLSVLLESDNHHVTNILDYLLEKDIELDFVDKKGFNIPSMILRWIEEPKFIYEVIKKIGTHNHREWNRLSNTGISLYMVAIFKNSVNFILSMEEFKEIYGESFELGLNICCTNKDFKEVFQVDLNSLIDDDYVGKYMRGSSKNNMKYITPLSYKIYMNHSIESCEKLIKMGVDLNLDSLGNDTYLKVALRRGNIECLNSLLKMGANPNLVTKGTDALSYIFLLNRFKNPLYDNDFFKLAMYSLLEYGANINTSFTFVEENSNNKENDNGINVYTMLSFMMSNKDFISKNIFNIILSAGGDPTVLIPGVNLNCFQLCISNVEYVSYIDTMFQNSTQEVKNNIKNALDIDMWESYLISIGDNFDTTSKIIKENIFGGEEFYVD